MNYKNSEALTIPAPADSSMRISLKVSWQSVARTLENSIESDLKTGGIISAATISLMGKLAELREDAER